MDTELLDGLTLTDGNLCTPQGFYLDTFEYQSNGVVGCVTILVADNPCTVGFKYPQRLVNQSLDNSQRLERTKGIAQAVIVGICGETLPQDFGELSQMVAVQLDLFDDDFLLDFKTLGFNGLNGDTHSAVQFDIYGVACTLGILKLGDTMYITTDVAITHNMVTTALCELHMDGTFCLLASGQAGNMVITKCNYTFNIFKKALNYVVTNLN